MNKIWIASFFILCCSSWAQTPATNTVDTSKPEAMYKSSFGPLPDPEMKFDLSRFPGYQTNVQTMRNAANTYRIEYIRRYRDEYVRTRGLPDKTKSFENTEIREVEFINRLPPNDLFKITFPAKPERLKQIMDITAIDLESSLGFQAFKELHLVQTQLETLQKAIVNRDRLNMGSASVNEPVKNDELEQLKQKIQEQEKFKLYFYVVGLLAVLSLGMNVIIYKKFVS
jgi:hypothetical protein